MTGYSHHYSPSLVMLNHLQNHYEERPVIRLLNSVIDVADQTGDDIGGDDDENGGNSALTYGAIIGTGFLMGVVHVLSGPDHLSALATLAVGNSFKAFWLGIRWGLGHSTGLILVAILFICMDDRIDLESISKYCNWIVGVFMIVLGLYGMYTSNKKYSQRLKNNEISQLQDADDDFSKLEGKGQDSGEIELATVNSNTDSHDNNNNDNEVVKIMIGNRSNSNNNDHFPENKNSLMQHKTKTTSKIKESYQGQSWSDRLEDDTDEQEGENQPLTQAGQGKGGSYASSFNANWLQFRTFLSGVSSQGGVINQTSFSSVPFHSPENSPKTSQDDPSTSTETTISSNKIDDSQNNIQMNYINESTIKLQDKNTGKDLVKVINQNNKENQHEAEHQQIITKRISSSEEEEIVVDLGMLPHEDEKEDNEYEKSSVDNKDVTSSVDSSTFISSSALSPSSPRKTKGVTWKDKLHMQNPIMQRIVAFGIGIVHGIAGPGGILGVIPAVEYNNWVKSVLYLGTFCLTSTLIMGLFAALYGVITSKMASTMLIEYRLGIFSAFLSVAVGVTWISLVAVHKLDEVFE